VGLPPRARAPPRPRARRRRWPALTARGSAAWPSPRAAAPPGPHREAQAFQTVLLACAPVTAPSRETTHMPSALSKESPALAACMFSCCVSRAPVQRRQRRDLWGQAPPSPGPTTHTPLALAPGYRRALLCAVRRRSACASRSSRRPSPFWVHYWFKRPWSGTSSVQPLCTLPRTRTKQVRTLCSVHLSVYAAPLGGV